MIKAVIVDDEPKAIHSLIWELSNFKNEIENTNDYQVRESLVELLNRTLRS